MADRKKILAVLHYLIENADHKYCDIKDICKLAWLAETKLIARFPEKETVLDLTFYKSGKLPIVKDLDSFMKDLETSGSVDQNPKGKYSSIKMPDTSLITDLVPGLESCLLEPWSLAVDSGNWNALPEGGEVSPHWVFVVPRSQMAPRITKRPNKGALNTRKLAAG